jgi:FkbM family methyltransferase
VKRDVETIDIDLKQSFASYAKESLQKGLFLKPSLKVLKNRKDAPYFWTMPHDTICRDIVANGLYEKKLVHGMLALVKDRKGAFIDVGANIGNHSMFFSRHFDQVISFEPSERNNWIFKANVELNRVRNVTLVEKGLSNEAGYVRLDNELNTFDTNNGFGDAALSPTRSDARMIEISIGDMELEKFPSLRVLAIKVDVEGNEHKVLEGLQKTIEKHRPVIFWEAFEYDLAVQSMNVLKKFGYSEFRHLSAKRQGLGPLARVQNSLNPQCEVRPINPSTSLDGMNFARF